MEQIFLERWRGGAGRLRYKFFYDTGFLYARLMETLANGAGKNLQLSESNPPLQLFGEGPGVRY